MEEEKKIQKKIQFTQIGLQSVRYNSVGVLQEGKVVHALGSGFAVFDSELNAIVDKRTWSEGLLSVIKVRNHKGIDRIFGITYDGTIGIWEGENYELRGMIDTELRFIRNATVCSQGKFIALCSEMQDQFAIFEWIGKNKFEEIYRVKEAARFCQFSSSRQVAVFTKVVDSLYSLTLLSDTFKVLNKSDFSPGSSIVAIKNFGEAQGKNSDLLVLELLNKTILVLKFEADTVNQVLSISDSQTSGVPLVYENQLFLNYSIGKMDIYTFVEKTEPIQETHYIGNKIPAFVNGVWVKNRERLVTYEDGSIKNYFFLAETMEVLQVQLKECFSLTCCGASLNSNAQLAAFGDLSGNVKIFRYVKQSKPPIAEDTNLALHASMSVRCVAFHPYFTDLLVFGTLSTGDVILARIKDSKVDGPYQIMAFNTTITSLRWFNTPKKKLLACGLTSGEVALLQVTNNLELDSERKFKAHEQGKSSDDFGSLNLQAQVWSLDWRPEDENWLATVSEDQTMKVWKITKQGPVEKFKLQHHSKAVTCVDWVKHSALGEIIINCSDDQYVNIYTFSESEVKLVQQYCTSSLMPEWHTLTYLKFFNDKVAVGAQDGYIVIWNIASGKLEYFRKVHNGGIEGLDWKQGLIAICANDCAGSLIAYD